MRPPRPLQPPLQKRFRLCKVRGGVLRHEQFCGGVGGTQGRAFGVPRCVDGDVAG